MHNVEAKAPQATHTYNGQEDGDHYEADGGCARGYGCHFGIGQAAASL